MYRFYCTYIYYNPFELYTYKWCFSFTFFVLTVLTMQISQWCHSGIKCLILWCIAYQEMQCGTALCRDGIGPAVATLCCRAPSRAGLVSGHQRSSARVDLLHQRLHQGVRPAGPAGAAQEPQQVPHRPQLRLEVGLSFFSCSHISFWQN